MKAVEENKLHTFIKLLSKAEKSYLKKYSKIFLATRDTKLKVYYSILEKMPEYSKEDLKKQLDKQGGFRSYKNTEAELYNQILQDLVLIKSKNNPEWQFLIEHMKMRLLFFENQFDESLKHYDVLYKLKEKTSNVSVDYMYYKYYYYSLTQMKYSRNQKDIKKINDVEEKLRQNIQDLNLEFLLQSAVHNFDNIRHASFNKTKNEFISDLKSFEQKYLDVIPKKLETTKLKLLATYYYLFCHYYLQIQDYEQLAYYSGLYYERFNSKNIRERYYHEFVNALAYKTTSYIYTYDRKVYKILEEMKTYIDRTNFYELKSFFYSMYCQLSLLANIKLNDMEQLAIFVKNNREDYTKLSKSATTPSYLNTDLLWAIGFYKLNRIKEAQPYLDKIFASLGKIDKVFNKILVTARVLDILIHFHLKNYENLEYYIVNLENEMKRNAQLLPFDIEFFKHLKKISAQLFAKQPLDKKPFFNFLQNNCDEDRLETYRTYIDMEIWLEELSEQ